MFYNKWIWINRFITSIFRHHTDKSGMWKNYKCFGWVIVKSLTQNHSSPVLIPNRFVVVNVFEKDTPFEMKITSDWDEDYFLWMKSWSWMVAWLKRVFSVSEYGSVQIISWSTHHKYQLGAYLSKLRQILTTNRSININFVFHDREDS